jgi:DNA sulfur modification protein DndC
MRQLSLFEDQRMTFKEAIDTSIASLSAYGAKYSHWMIAYSGGKDSSATASFVTWAIHTGQIKAPESLTILYADTRQELQPLWSVAQLFMDKLRGQGFNAQTVLPELDERFYVYMLGRGVPPPSNRFRWCTEKIKITPMERALEARRAETGEKFLGLTGVRLGESAQRDARIAVSCSKDSGECGQGWFQTNPPDAVSDTLAPLLHWRLCFVWDWLYFACDDAWMKFAGINHPGHGYIGLGEIAEIYGDDEARTGCVGCALASRDKALENLVKNPKWSHLRPLLEIKPLFKELKKPKWRLRKGVPEKKKDGSYAKNGQRMGPLTMEGRAFGLERILDIQRRAGVDLINAEEEARIREMWSLGVYPERWSESDVAADLPVDKITTFGHDLIVQPLLVGD